ncbi:septum site-determining protein MinC [Ancylobacter dichloromethanicus]|uniref:Probable septum site-determining protein MinC n=1 Tax=Ancylobacter dichloromethanicus TaxID=518825 RepID=A0A9W6J7D9_9HYPH|nr:septum site-determining protein MinC [Ancylobacter dichloromethanicus]MBS7552802.1 septum site-determining protein MinC [Ancylobacter dichloromethanicus]GLK72166.1 putative septum site-determining protein MinC [Ancylobacter dichloromethanicus]
MNAVSQTGPSIRFRGRSFMAMTLVADVPLAAWLADFDVWLQRSPGFFTGRTVVLDLAGTAQSKAEVERWISELATRGVRLVGLEGVRPSLVDAGMPPILRGGRDATLAAAEFAVAPAEARKPVEPVNLLVDRRVRSGQSIVCLEGDVTIIGSVGAGAEIIAGGSIHVYGTLAGRAIAGATFGASAQIFCSKLEAELLAVDGIYRTAEDIDDAFRGKAVRVSTDDETLRLTAL